MQQAVLTRARLARNGVVGSATQRSGPIVGNSDVAPLVGNHCICLGLAKDQGDRRDAAYRDRQHD
jgi:hypothetical protein